MSTPGIESGSSASVGKHSATTKFNVYFDCKFKDLKKPMITNLTDLLTTQPAFDVKKLKWDQLMSTDPSLRQPVRDLEL